MPAEFVENPIGMRELLYSPIGPVGVYLRRVGEAVQDAAKEKVGVSDRTAIPGDMRKPRSGEHLRDTIVRKFTIGELGPEIQVGSDAPYAEYHHEPQDQYDITTDADAKPMVFYASGGWVFTHRVTHPAWPGNPFLTEPMDAIVTAGIVL